MVDLTFLTDMADKTSIIWLITTMTILSHVKSGAIIKENVIRTITGKQIIDSYIDSNGNKIVCNENQTALLERTMECLEDSELNEKGCRYVKTRIEVPKGTNCSVTYFKRKEIQNLMDGPIDVTYRPSFNAGKLQFPKRIEDNSKYFGYKWELKFNCTDRETENVTQHCLIFTTPKLVIQEINSTTSSTLSQTTNKLKVTAEDVKTTTTATTTTIYHTSNQTTQESSNFTTLVSMTTSYRATLSNSVTKKFISSTTVPNSTTTPLVNKGKKSSSDVIIYSTIAGCLVILLALALIYIFCCRKRRRSVAGKDNLIYMAPYQDDDVVFPSSPDDLYAKPKKRKRRQCPCFKQRKTNEPVVDWSGYDEVGSVIKGTYEVRESTSAGDFDNRETETTALVQEDPYEIIGRTNSFTPGRLKRDEGKDESPAAPRSLKLKQTTLTPPETEDEPSEMSLKSIESLHDVINSTFKPGGSLRIKQQRTSMRKNINKENITHEDVRITPPVSKRGSLNTSITSLPEKSNVIVSEPEQKTESDRPLSETGITRNSSDFVEKDTNLLEDSMTRHGESDGKEIGVSKSTNDTKAYEEIWNRTDDTKQNTQMFDDSNSDSHLNDTESRDKAGDNANQHYPPVQIMPKSDSGLESSKASPGKTDYIDVDIY